jgi:hypothetical protein
VALEWYTEFVEPLKPVRMVIDDDDDGEAEGEEEGDNHPWRPKSAAVLAKSVTHCYMNADSTVKQTWSDEKSTDTVEFAYFRANIHYYKDVGIFLFCFALWLVLQLAFFPFALRPPGSICVNCTDEKVYNFVCSCNVLPELSTDSSPSSLPTFPVWLSTKRNALTCVFCSDPTPNYRSDGDDHFCQRAATPPSAVFDLSAMGRIPRPTRHSPRG